jgi:hypothetical protein
MEHRSFGGSPSVIFLCQEPSFTMGVLCVNAGAGRSAQMSPGRKSDAEEERLAALEEIGIEEKALVYDEAGDKLLVSDDAAAIKDFYARAFQEWSLGNVEGTAEEIFDAVSLLVGDD